MSSTENKLPIKGRLKNAYEGLHATLLAIGIIYGIARTMTKQLGRTFKDLRQNRKSGGPKL